MTSEFFWEVFLEGLGWLRGSSMAYVKPSVTLLVKKAKQIHFDLIGPMVPLIGKSVRHLG